MSWRCDLTGKKPLVGHKVSHSNIKTKRRFLPNLQNVTLMSDSLGRRVRVRVSANALKTVDHRGGLDAFLLKAKDDELAPKMRELKRADRQEAEAAAARRLRTPLGVRDRLLPDQRELQQQAALERRKIIVRYHRDDGLALRVRCTAMPSMLSI